MVTSCSMCALLIRPKNRKKEVVTMARKTAKKEKTSKKKQ